MRRHMFAVMAVVLPLATAFAGAQSSSAVPPSRPARAALPTSVELLSGRKFDEKGNLRNWRGLE